MTTPVQPVVQRSPAKLANSIVGFDNGGHTLNVTALHKLNVSMKMAQQAQNSNVMLSILVDQ